MDDNSVRLMDTSFFWTHLFEFDLICAKLGTGFVQRALIFDDEVMLITH